VMTKKQTEINPPYPKPKPPRLSNEPNSITNHD
jgi:hypothetical protein